MDNTQLSLTLSRLIPYTTQCYATSDRAVTVNDLRLCIRDMRLSEISDYSNEELDLVEAHAARFEGAAPLDQVLEEGAYDEPALAGAGAELSSPSPFAWT